MEMRPLSAGIYVSGQINADDVESAAAQGIKTLICARPDNESPGQPEAKAIADAAKKFGLNFVHIPIAGGVFDNSAIESFAELLADPNQPVLMYCGSGMRAAALWVLANAKDVDRQELLTAAANCGYDLSGLTPRIEQICADTVTTDFHSERHRN
jgi:sulfide:quinone oxidoreductase